MTVADIGNGIYVGMFADTKPTVNIVSNAIFFERDTGRFLRWNGTAWAVGAYAVYNNQTNSYGINNQNFLSSTLNIFNPAQTHLYTFVGQALAANVQVKLPLLATNDQFTFDAFATTLTNKAIDSTTNTLANVNPYKYTVYMSGSTCYCRNNLTGSIESSNVVIETVIQYALTNSTLAGIHIQNGTYNLSAAFAGFTISQNNTTIVCDPGALITVPGGFTGVLWKFAENTSGSLLIGGKHSENTTISRLWTFVQYNVAEGSIINCNVRDAYVRFAGKFAEFKVTGTLGFINGNKIADCFVDQFIQGMVWNQVSTLTSNNGVNRNHFSNITLQSYTGSTDGIMNVSGVSNYFDDVKVWDMTASGHGVTIAAGSTDTIMLGGITKTANGFSDLGVRTKIVENTNIILPNATLNTPTITSPTFISTVLAKSNLPVTTVFTDQTNTFGAFNQVFPSSQLYIQNPAGTFAYITAGSAITGNITITLPLLTANDQYTFDNFGTTLTNKTQVLTNNTLTDTSAALGDLIKHNGTKFLRLPKGTANQILAVNSAGTDVVWTAPPAASTIDPFGSFSKNGDATSLIFTQTHGLGSAPRWLSVTATSVDADDDMIFSSDATNITITYSFPPPQGTSNLSWTWRALL